jgi:hypothetical protein
VVTDKTVSFNGYTVPIKQLDPALIYFSNALSGGRKNAYGITDYVDGLLDRVTGALSASVTSLLGSNDKTATSQQWEIICRPTSRMF